MNDITRRKFLKIGAITPMLFSTSAKGMINMIQNQNKKVRIGGPVFKDFNDPIEWIKEHKKWGYSAAYCPLDADASTELIKAFELEAKRRDLIIAEVGAWSNPISPDDVQRNEAIEHCCKQLDLADRINANCCVNIAGSRSKNNWDGAHKDNLTRETFDLIVETTQKIIDTVKPKRTFFTLETMPWIYPDSVDSYLELLKAIDRPHFGVHFDPVNIINSPSRYYKNDKIIKDAFNRLGKYIKSCHGKDTIIRHELTIRINETQPGLGNLNYTVYFKELSKLDNVPLMLEHMEEPEEYREALTYLNGLLKKEGMESYSL
jgi:sugar phosphate isomerase/epimerase